ncbi:M67 family metallopeptidase [Aliifodinibius sp. S!AR15-10]|uniref:M67 family metallopeptidase n=1 Tax=Aliifodinibius sp. S!AR15-10 TaxID=2950437 RepID=UPI00285CACC4|nr:M67 family metallopeptidase [Aliifodinibius sp. S!AR15-10]MDR8392269.1 M67 family metallopeptidase [Aliifodinibius sp. S!AR15-10]
MKVVIEEQALAEMERHAEEYYPNECCGFFYGKDGDVRKITLAKRVDNTKEGDQRRRFQIDPKDYQEAERYAIEHDLDLLGVYHSHPDHPAVPSEHDRKVAMPFFSYIIVSVEDGEAVVTRSWQLNEERQFEEEAFQAENIKDKQIT